MKKKYPAFICAVVSFLAFILLTESSLAVDISLEVQKEFQIGDDLKFSYSIVASNDSEIIFAPGIVCDNIPVPSLIPMKISLSKGEIYSSNYSEGTIKPDYPSSKCIAFIKVLEPLSFLVNKSFNINALKEWNLQVFICEKDNCNTKERYFSPGSDIFISYSASIKNPSLNAIIEKPSGKKTKVTLPTSFHIYESGQYTLKIEASAKQYQNKSISEYFFGVDKSPNFQKKEFPSQESPSQKVSGHKDKKTSAISFILLILVVILLFAFLRRRSRRGTM